MNIKPKLVGHINIEVWSGNPSDENSYIKQTVKENNSIHDCMLNDDYFNGKAYKIGSHYNNDFWLRNAELRMSYKENNKEQALNNTGYSGEIGNDEKNSYIYANSFSLAVNTVGTTPNRRYKLSPFNTKVIEQMDTLLYPSNTSYSYNFGAPLFSESISKVAKMSISRQFNPLGFDGHLYDIGAYFTSNYSNSNSQTGILEKGYNGVGFTYHVFEAPIMFAATDYLKVTYTVMVEYTIELPPTKLYEITNKDGEAVKAIQFNVIEHATGAATIPCLQGIFDAIPEGVTYTEKELTPYRDFFPNSDYFPRALIGVGSILTKSVLGVIFETTPMAGNYTGDRIKYRLSFSDNEVKKEYDSYLNEVFLSKFNGKTLWRALHSFMADNNCWDSVDNLEKALLKVPILSAYDSNKLYDSSLNSAYQNKDKVHPYTEKIEQQIKLPAEDNNKYNGNILGFVHELGIGGGNSTMDSGTIVIITLFEKPLVKTKFDEIVIKALVGGDGAFYGKSFYSEALSHTEEVEG